VRVSLYTPILYSTGRSDRQRLPTVDTRHVVLFTRHPCPTT